MSNHHVGLIYGMVLASAASPQGVDDKSLITIGNVCKYLPIFQNFDNDELDEIAASCVELLSAESGVDLVLDMVEETLPDNLFETFYALAVEIVCVHSVGSQAELTLLEEIRHRFDIDRLTGAAIERGARARYHPVQDR